MKTILKCKWTGEPCGINDKITMTKSGKPVNNSKYTKFKESLAWEMKVAKLMHKDGSKENYEGEVYLGLHVHTRYDADSLIKPVMDALQMAHIIKDDKQVTTLHVVKRPPDKYNTIEIEVLGETDGCN